MADNKGTVLITGCSDGGMGAALAIEFHTRGFHVYATARNLKKMQSLQALDIDILPLDITSDSSIAACVAKLSRLDILVNNAGATYTMPISDISIPEAKANFDLNVWGHIAIIQAFLPLLLKSPNAIIANHTSVGAGVSFPFQATYNAGKAAMSRFSDTLRLELECFDIRVIDLKTGGVKTGFIKNRQVEQPRLPENSIYAPAREAAEKALKIEWAEDIGIMPEQWAREVAGDLLKPNPPAEIYRGSSAKMVQWMRYLIPWYNVDSMMKGMMGFDRLEKIIRGNKVSGSGR